MSTFGKKALIKWDYTYNSDNVSRYQKSWKTNQLKILQKWYPISNGMFIYQNELWGTDIG